MVALYCCVHCNLKGGRERGREGQRGRGCSAAGNTHQDGVQGARSQCIVWPLHCRYIALHSVCGEVDIIVCLKVTLFLRRDDVRDRDRN